MPPTTVCSVLVALAIFTMPMGLAIEVSSRAAPTDAPQPVLPFSRLSFPRHRDPHSTPAPYLSKSILKDRVPGGWNTFVAHMYLAQDPMHHFSVLPPKRGCGTLDTPGSTADAFGGCDVATNGGFFVPGDDTVDHKCIGPIVSNGYWRHHEHRNNVMFGIEAPHHEADGNVSYFFGYMDEDDMQEGRWLQLVSGVVWLVHDGKPFVQESMQYDNFTAERSGTGQQFASLKAPRLSIGMTSTGSLLLLAIDGSEPDWEGLSLGDVASVLIGLGAVEAINLDGGGSVSVFEGDDVVNVPSDVCPDATFPKFRCPRKVSSIMCLHKYATPRITHTATRPRSQTVLPSMTTFSMSLSNAKNDVGDDAGVGSGPAQRFVVLLAEVMIPAVLLLWVVSHLLWRWQQWQRNRGEGRTALGSAEDLDDEDTDDMDYDGRAVVGTNIELKMDRSVGTIQ